MSVRGVASLAVVALWIVSVAQATVWNVSTVSEFKTAMANVNPGDTIYVQYGTYQVTPGSDPKHWFKRAGTEANPIYIIGVLSGQGDRPVFDASGTDIDRGIFYIWPQYPNYVIENLEFRNSHGGATQSNNAAAAYIRASNITFRNCYSHHNDNGWFSTSEADNTLLEYCETAYNGYPPDPGHTHNYYVNSISLTVRGNYIHHSTTGQNFKSRCSHLVFENNWVEEDANYTWEVASNNVNNALMIGNVIIKGPDAANSRIIGCGDGSGVASGTLTLINNTIVATRSNNRYLYSHSSSTTNLVLYNNIFTGPSTILFSWNGSGSRTGSHNWFQTGMSVPGTITDSLFGTSPGFVDPGANDFHLLPDSVCRDAGTNSPQWLNGSGMWEVRVPEGQYVRHLQTMPRPADGALDIGAYEYALGDMDYDGDVDLDDLAEFVTAMSGPGQSAGNDDADLDGDGDCDLADFGRFAANFSGAY
ncbi:MAG: hypothetical protein ACE5K7_00420 [Phycisphaerae bacterium]